MPRLTAQVNMHPPITMMMMMVVMMMCALMLKAAAQPRCDPLTQYEKGGECCTMCPPGTSMRSDSTCADPRCRDCEENEYQEKYTTESQCERQPYCDPNKNFQNVAHESKKKRTICRCMLGFHCSSETCLTCVAHTTCKPGDGAVSVGNQTHDTVCRKCPEGQFNAVNSWNSVCKKWTECTDGHHIQQRGTDTSDTTCEESSRKHIGVICTVLAVLLVVIIVGVACFLSRGGAKRKVKGCFESCRGERQMLPRETNGLMVTPVDQADEEPTFPEMVSSQEECGMRTPEENEDEQGEDVSGGVILTDKGNFVTQENGKAEILSRQESQTQTFHSESEPRSSF